MTATDKAAKLKDEIRTLFEAEGLRERENWRDDGDYRWREDYSGRGMFGKTSSVAVTMESYYHPGSPVGKALIDLGLCRDSMGLGFIYYTHW